MPVPELKQYVAQHKDTVNAPFMFWLADLERKAQGAEKQRLSALAAEVVAVQV